MNLTPSELERLWSKIDKSDACWLWTGAKDHKGYGHSGLGRPHRVLYELLVGPIPPGLQLDHLCRVRHCVNPAHLEAVTPIENSRRGFVGRYQSSKTHCPQGHPYQGDNLFVTRGGGRMCRTCMRSHGIESYHRKHGGVRRRTDGQMTQCPSGHPYSGDNLRFDSQGYRSCRTCKREQWQRAYRKRRGVH